MTTLTLSKAQTALLGTAIRNGGHTPNVRQAATAKVLEALAKRGLITAEGDGWKVTVAGYEALGQTPPEAPARDNTGASAVLLDEIDGGDPTNGDLAAAHAAQVAHDERVNALKEKAEAEAPTEAKPRRTREDSKQATVIRMLQHP